MFFYRLQIFQFKSFLVKVINSSFNNICFKDFKIMGVDWTKIIKKILPIFLKFENSIIDLSTFNSLKINKLEIINCSAKEVDFRESILIAADFSYSDLEKSLFHHSNLESANFIQTKNYPIDFNNNKITNSTHSIMGALNLLKTLKIKIEDFNITNVA